MIVFTALLVGACAGQPRGEADVQPATVVARSATAPAEESIREIARRVPAADTSTAIGQATALRVAFERARRLVADERGIDLDALTLALVEDDVIDERVRFETRRLVVHQFREPAYAEHFVERVMNTQSGTYAALYVSTQHRILVSRRALGLFLDDAGEPSVRAAALLALMIHEVIHAADDREHDIDAVRTLDFRAAFTQSAVFEGHAQWGTRRLCRQAGCLPGLEALDRFMFGGSPAADPLVPSSGTLSRNVLEYAYVEGERFVSALAGREQGEAALKRLLQSPPLDPIQILDPDSWPDTARESRNRALLRAASTADHPWARGDLARPARSVVTASPLKGVNLRDDPDRRRAAIDGFTRLLSAMTAVELHDEHDADAVPVAMTLLQAESAPTAALFARTLHANALAQPGIERSSSDDWAGVQLLRTATRSSTSASGSLRTLVARRGDTVLQLTADDEPEAMLDAYAQAVFEAL